MNRKNQFFSYCRCLLVALAVASVNVLPLLAQGSKVTGTVTDEAGSPLPGVNVVVKGTTSGTVTDAEGRYSIAVPNDEAVLQFSFMGYSSQEVVVGNQRDISPKLAEDTEQLDEVVVIGYGTARKRDLTGAISSVKTETLEAEAPRSVQDLLRGNAPGMNISLAPNADGTAQLRIRGVTTLKAGAEPLIVLDGVIYNGSLSDINPNDVQSLDILKDASSAAVYGAKAANGVIMINTKKGQGGKPVITVNANLGWAQLVNAPELLDAEGFIKYRQDYETGKNTDDYLAKYPEMFSDPRKLQNVSQLDWYNYTQKTPVSSFTDEELIRSWLSRLDFKAPEIDNYLAGKITKWDDLVFHTGFQQDYTASISNRQENISYYWSIGYTDREGIKVGNRFRSIRTRLNLESKITNFLSVGLHAGYSNRDAGFLTCDWEQMVRISPYGSNNIDDPDSPYRKYPTGDPTPVNPFYDNLYRDRDDMYHTLNANLYANVKLPLGIEYQVNFAPYYQFHNYFNHNSSHSETSTDGGNSEREHAKTFNWQIDNIFRWKRDFGPHRIEATALINAEKNQYWRSQLSASMYTPSDVLSYHRIQAGTEHLSDESDDTYNTGAAQMLRVFYSWRDRYMITASVRRDGYSAFGINHPWAVFPAVALGWTFTNESFLSGIRWLNYGKLRLSWGQNGNRDIGAYSALSDMTSNPHPYINQQGGIYTSSQLYVNRMSNYDLKWEKTTAYNVGIDFSLFGDILSGTVEGYLMQTLDLLVDRKLPDILGFSSVAANMGQLDNKGIEVSLTGNIIKQKNVTWSTMVNMSLNRRKVVHLYGDRADVLDKDGNVIGQKEADDITNGLFIGRDPDQIWNYERVGVWQLGEEEEAAKYGNQPGDFHYKDQNDDGKMTNDDKVFQHYTTPRLIWSWRNEVTFLKAFTFSAMVYANHGTWNTFNRAANVANFPDRCTDYVQPRWTTTNPINDYARIGSKNIGSNYVNKSFVRVSNLSLSYAVPKAILQKIQVQSLRVSVGVNNAFLFTAPGWFYFDPEQVRFYKDSDGTDNRNLVEPTPRTFTLSLNFTL